MPETTLSENHPRFGVRTHGARRVVDLGGGKRFFGTVLMVMGSAFVLLVSLVGLASGLMGATGGDLGAAVASAVGLVCVGMAMGAVPLGLGFVLRRSGTGAGEKDEEVAVYDGGMVIRINGGDTELAWADIAHFYRPPAKGRLGALSVSVPYDFFRVAGPDGFIFEARGLRGLQEMGEAVEAAVTPLRVAWAMQRLDAGELACFGELQLGEEGIRGFGLGGMLVKWADVDGFGIGKHNFFGVKERGNPFLQKGPLFIFMPDVEAFLEVVDRMRRRG